MDQEGLALPVVNRPEGYDFFYGPTPEAIQKSWPGDYNNLIERYYSLELVVNGRMVTMEYEEVCKLEDDMIDFRNYYCKKIGMYCPHGSGPYSGNIRRISDVKKMLIIEKDPNAALCYSEDSVVIMMEGETVNGYALFPTDEDIMDYETFIDLRRCSDRYVPDEEFSEWFHETACREWSKMNRNGDYVGLSDGLLEDNLKGLLELPYPREVIKKTIDNNMNESVRYSNFICEWVRRKSRLVYKCPTLQSLCVELVPRVSLPEHLKDLAPPEIVVKEEPKVLSDAVPEAPEIVLDIPFGVEANVWQRIRLINYESRFVIPEDVVKDVNVAEDDADDSAEDSAEAIVDTDDKYVIEKMLDVD